MVGFVNSLVPYLKMSGTVTDSTYDDLMTSITNTFSVDIIVGIMASIVTKGAPYALLYWGARKALRAIFSAVKKGKVRV